MAMHRSSRSPNRAPAFRPPTPSNRSISKDRNLSKDSKVLHEGAILHDRVSPVQSLLQCLPSTGVPVLSGLPAYENARMCYPISRKTHTTQMSFIIEEWDKADPKFSYVRLKPSYADDNPWINTGLHMGGNGFINIHVFRGTDPNNTWYNIRTRGPQCSMNPDDYLQSDLKVEGIFCELSNQIVQYSWEKLPASQENPAGGYMLNITLDPLTPATVLADNPNDSTQATEDRQGRSRRSSRTNSPPAVRRDGSTDYDRGASITRYADSHDRRRSQSRVN